MTQNTTAVPKAWRIVLHPARLCCNQSYRQASPLLLACLQPEGFSLSLPFGFCFAAHAEFSFALIVQRKNPHC